MKNLILLINLLAITSLHAFEAKFLHIKGEVKLNGQTVIDKKTPLTKPFLIQTGANSLAVVSVNKKTVLKVNENSVLDISGVTNPNPEAELRSGSVFSFIKKAVNKQQRDAFTLRAKGVAMGVRGTTFFASYGKTDDIWMCVNEGTVAVSNETSKKETLVNAGEGIVSKPGKNVSDPKPLKWTQKLNWKYNPEEGSLENNVSIQEAYVDLLNADYD